jgi:hypothetical protein
VGDVVASAGVSEGREVRRARLPIGRWERDRMQTPQVLVLSVVSSMANVAILMMVADATTRAFVIGAVTVSVMAILQLAQLLGALPPAAEPLEVDGSGVWVRTELGERRHVSFGALHMVRGHRGWLAFLGAEGAPLFAIRTNEHAAATEIAHAARHGHQRGELVRLPGLTARELWTLGRLLFGYGAMTLWVSLVVYAPAPLDVLASLVLVVSMVHVGWRVRSAPAFELRLRPEAGYRDHAR